MILVVYHIYKMCGNLTWFQNWASNIQTELKE